MMMMMEEEKNNNKRKDEQEEAADHSSSSNGEPATASSSGDDKPLEESELSLPVRNLGRHISRVKQRTPNGGDGFDLEFNYVEKKSESDSFFGDYDSAVRPVNRAKNRYSNVLPLEKTRVKLKLKNQMEGSDYINANWIDGLIPGSERAYITTQGPLQETVEDFWRMVSETGSNVIVMLTKEVENDKIKCTHYWPLEPGNMFTFDNIRVSLADEVKTFENKLVERTLQLENLDTGDWREIKHYQYLDWPDHGLPESAAAFRKILHKVDKVRAKKSPIVVHCSAGIGRTGTFCTVHSALEKLHLHMKEKPNEAPEFNVLQTVLRMREQRVGMVQTKEQYIFCYKALLEETQKLGLTPPTTEHLV